MDSAGLEPVTFVVGIYLIGQGEGWGSETIGAAICSCREYWVGFLRHTLMTGVPNASTWLCNTNYY